MPQTNTRIPNFLHLLLFLALIIGSFALSEAFVLAVAHGRPILENLTDQKLQLTANILTYLVALTASWFVFPLLWHRSFLAGLQWNAPAARYWFALCGLVLGFVAQAVTSFLPTPKNLPIEEFFHNPATIWLLAGFGTLLAPLFEEILFRGFLLPAIAIAVDWLRLPRNENAAQTVDTWRHEASFTPLALVISSILTSILFALLHAPQLGYTWPAISLLAAISLVLCYVRVRTRSVAAGTLIHASYNLSVFITLFITTGGFRHLERA